MALSYGPQLLLKRKGTIFHYSLSTLHTKFVLLLPVNTQ